MSVSDVPVDAGHQFVVALIGGETCPTASVVTIMTCHIVRNSLQISVRRTREVVVGITHAVVRAAPAINDGRNLDHLTVDEEEKFILKNKCFNIDQDLRVINDPQMPLRSFFQTKEDIMEVLAIYKSYHDTRGVRKFEDYFGRQVHIIGGHRLTTSQPTSGKHTIYLIGGCSVFGVGASDKGTIASHLQKMINERFPEQEFVVQNYGYFLLLSHTHQLSVI